MPWLINAGGIAFCTAIAFAISGVQGLSCLWKALWIEAVVAGWCFVWTLLVVRKGTPASYWTAARTFALVFTAAAIFVISSTRPIEIGPRGLAVRGRPAADSATRELVRMELEKTNQEIQLRVGQEDTWFHYKFLVLGALVAAFGGMFTFGARQDRELDVAAMVRSPAACTLLAMACIVALAIDIHLRNNIIVIQQLGLWIGQYAEPALTGTQAAGFVPWEQFLRMPGAGMHSDNLYGFLFYPHLHFMTWVVYVLYLCCFHALTVDRVKARRPLPNFVLAASFAGVHLAFAMFAWVGHFVPGAFVTNVIPFAQCWHTGARAALGYLGLAGLLAFANGPFFWTMLRREP